MKTLKQHIIDTVKEVFGMTEQTEISEISHDRQYFLKDKDGNYSKWVGVYSNSFRDDDLVPEILESGGHEEFVKQVDAGIYDYPELWIWHNPKWKIGKATFVAVDVVQPGVVFAIAGGYVDPEHYGVAKAIAESNVEWRMSHTFISHSRNDTMDSYRKWVTLEVSVLPAGKEANPLTSFGLLSSEETMIDAKKREEIKSALGLNDAELDALESQNASKAIAALDNREFKEKSEEAPEAEAMEQVAEDNVEAEAKEAVEGTPELKEETAEVVEEAPVEAVAEEVVAEETAVIEEEDAAQLVDDGNMFAQFADLLKSMDRRMDAMTEALNAAEEKAKELEARLAEREEKEIKSASPLASMGGYQDLFAKYSANGGVIGGGAVVDEEEDAELLKSKPEEAKPVNRIGSKFNSPLLSKYVQAGS